MNNYFKVSSYVFNYCAIKNIEYDLKNAEKIKSFSNDKQIIKYNGLTIKHY